jgi:succinoglycan biosynthesis protein ExoA
MGRHSGFVDHGHHAAFRREAFVRAGGYDESFEANEDAELDARIRARGGRIWLDVDNTVTYFPRSTIEGLARQYWRYGAGRARTALKHGERLRMRQMLPPVALIAVLAGLLLAPWMPVMLMLPLGYFTALGRGTIQLVLAERSACVWGAGPALATMHFAWGAGFLRRMLSPRTVFAEAAFRGTAGSRPSEGRNEGKA